MKKSGCCSKTCRNIITMADREQFMSFWLDKLGFKSKKDLYENLYLKAFIDSYHRIGKDSILEEKIRDRFVFDLERENPLTKDWIQQQILFLNWERWINVSEEEKSRADISFSISGCENLLKKSCSDWEYSFQSRHDRSDNTCIHLYHLFFDFIPHETRQ